MCPGSLRGGSKARDVRAEHALHLLERKYMRVRLERGDAVGREHFELFVVWFVCVTDEDDVRAGGPLTFEEFPDARDDLLYSRPDIQIPALFAEAADHIGDDYQVRHGRLTPDY